MRITTPISDGSLLGYHRACASSVSRNTKGQGADHSRGVSRGIIEREIRWMEMLLHHTTRMDVHFGRLMPWGISLTRGASIDLPIKNIRGIHLNFRIFMICTLARGSESESSKLSPSFRYLVIHRR